MEAKNLKIFQIKMNEFGTDLYMRNLVPGIYDAIKSRDDFSSYEIILIDFSGVTSVSSGFAFDLFQKLRSDLKENFLQKIRVQFDKQKDQTILRTVVREAFNTKPQT